MATGGVATTPKNVFGFDPRSVTGCAMWLDAADSSTLTGSPVTSIRDKLAGITLTKAGTGSITTTTINSVQALNFDGNSYLSGVLNNLLSGSAFIVWNASTSIATWRPFFTWTTNSTLKFPAFGYVYVSGSANTVGPYTTNINTGSPTTVVTVGSSYMASYSWNGIRATVGFNGAVPTTGLQPNPYSDTSSSFLICNENGSLTQTVIGEIIVYNSLVSDEQRQQIEGYLAWKWGLNTSIPTKHPYYSLRPFGRIFQPIDIENCQLWLDAADTSTVIRTSGTTVTSWIDKSGYGRTLYQSAGSGTTTYVSYGPGYSVKLNNSYMYTFNPVDLTTYTVFIVALAQTAVDNQAVFSAISGLVVTGAASFNSTDSFGFYMDSLASTRLDSRFYGSLLANVAVNAATTVNDKIPLALYTYTETANGVLNSWVNGASAVSSTTPLAAFTYSVTAISSTTTTVTYTVAGTFGLFVNSIVVITGATSSVYNGTFYVSSLTLTTFTVAIRTTGGATSAATAKCPGVRTNTAAGFTIGGEYYSGGFSGVSVTSIANLYEIVVYNRVLTTAQRQRVEGYLAWKWGFTYNQILTITHPFYNYPPTSIPAFNPGHIQGLDLWIDAASDTSDTGTITSIPDRSKNAYSVVPYSTDTLSITRNYLNGLPAYTPGTNRATTTNMYWSSYFTTFVIYKGSGWLYSGSPVYNYTASWNSQLMYLNNGPQPIDGGFVISWNLSGAPLPTINSPNSITLPSPTYVSYAISVQTVAISATRSTNFSFTVPATAGQYSYYALNNGTTSIQYLLNVSGGTPVNIYLFFGTNATISVTPGTIVSVVVTNTTITTYLNGTSNRSDTYTNSGSAPYTLQFYVLSNGTGGTTTYSNIIFDSMPLGTDAVNTLNGSGWNMFALGYSSGSQAVVNYSINGLQRTSCGGAALTGNSAGNYPYFGGTSIVPTTPETVLLNGNTTAANSGISAFAEFLHYNISLSPEQRQKIEGYLAWKWGLQKILPTYHPYYKFSPAATIPYVFSMNTFASSNFNLNGTAIVTVSTLQLTPIGTSLSSSAFYINKVKITNFTTYFNMTFTNTNADGSTFCIQNYACNAVSASGGSLGYNPTFPTSVAITFKTYASNAFAGNTGILSTELLTNGAAPALAGFSGNLNSTMSLTSNTTWNFGTIVSYDGNSISWKIVNLANLSTVSYSSTINLPSIVGADYAWVGFTSGTSGATESCFVNYWNYNAF